MVVVPCFNVNVDVLIVAGSIGILKVALTILFNTTPVSLGVGLVVRTRGCKVAPVLNENK